MNLFPPLTQYTAAEYAQMAIYFRAAGDVHAALACSGKALDADPEHMLARFLAAAIHADVGLTARAIQGFQDLLERNPEWDGLRLRLGLLFTNAGQLDRAREQLATLAGSKDPALARYGEALLALIAKDVSQAREKMNAGLAAAQRDPEITAVMRELAAKLAEADDTTSAAPVGGTAAVLRAYNRSPNT